MENITKKISARWNRLPVAVRVFMFGYLLCTLVVILAGLVIRAPVLRGRENLILLFSRVIQADANQRTPGESMMSRLDTVTSRNGVEIWLADENGNVFSSTEQRPPPFPWSEFVVPEEEYQIAWIDRVGWRDRLAVVRLVSRPTQYAIFLFGQKGSFERFGFPVLLAMLFMVVLGISLYAQRIAQTVLPESPQNA